MGLSKNIKNIQKPHESSDFWDVLDLAQISIKDHPKSISKTSNEYLDDPIENGLVQNIKISTNLFG